MKQFILALFLLISGQALAYIEDDYHYGIVPDSIQNIESLPLPFDTGRNLYADGFETEINFLFLRDGVIDVKHFLLDRLVAFAPLPTNAVLDKSHPVHGSTGYMSEGYSIDGIKYHLVTNKVLDNSGNVYYTVALAFPAADGFDGGQP